MKGKHMMNPDKSRDQNGSENNQAPKPADGSAPSNNQAVGKKSQSSAEWLKDYTRTELIVRPLSTWVIMRVWLSANQPEPRWAAQAIFVLN